MKLFRNKRMITPQMEKFREFGAHQGGCVAGAKRWSDPDTERHHNVQE